MAKAHQFVTETTSQSKKPGTPGGDGISGSTSFDWHDGDLAPQYSKHLSGFEGITHTGMNAAKQNNNGADRSGKPGSASAREAKNTNASFDRSIYQSLVKSMREGK